MRRLIAPKVAAVFRIVVPLLLGIGLEAHAPAAALVAGPLVGTWRLVTYTDTPAGEAPVLEFGAEPIGLFIFTADGHVSISIMRNPPNSSAPTTDDDPDACMPEWFCAYFGTYDVDYQAGTWTTHVRGGNIPAWLGTDQKRHFSIHGGRLTVAGSYERGGKTVQFERVLARESVHR
jgi:hypothetical protein